MTYEYSFKQFQKDLETASNLTENIARTGQNLQSRIEEYLKMQSIPGEVLFVGSTNPNRLTTIVDPTSPDDRYPSDFDICLILENPVEEEQEKKILEEILPNGQTVRQYGRTERHAYIEKIPTSMCVVPKKDESIYDPIQYTRMHRDFTPEQIETIRALRLFAMRNGLYCGFTEGLKGIALEQMVKQQGNFEDVMKWLSRTEQLDVLSPLNGHNLTGCVQEDIKERLRNAVETYLKKDTIKATPYTIESWVADHPDCTNLRLTSRQDDPHKSFKATRKLLDKLLNTIAKIHKTENPIGNAVLIIPHYGNNEVLLGAELTPEMIEGFKEGFSKRWDQANGKR